MPPVGILLSGGLDSAVLLGELLDEGREVRPFYVRCGHHWEPAEEAALVEFLEVVDTLLARREPSAAKRLLPLVTLEMPLAEVYPDHWSMTGSQTPDAQTADEAVFLPGRNTLLIVKTALWCQLHAMEELFLATLAGNPFEDATDEFFVTMQRVMQLSVDRPLRLSRPYATLSKAEVIRRGVALPLELTFSCIGPVGRYHCGRCNKCAERQAAFALAGLADPTHYAAASDRSESARR